MLECQICYYNYEKPNIKKCKYKHKICIDCLDKNKNKDKCYYCYNDMKIYNDNFAKKCTLNILYFALKIID